MFGYLVIWLFGCLIVCLFVGLVVWSFGCLVVLFSCLFNGMNTFIEGWVRLTQWASLTRCCFVSSAFLGLLLLPWLGILRPRWVWHLQTFLTLRPILSFDQNPQKLPGTSQGLKKYKCLLQSELTSKTQVQTKMAVEMIILRCVCFW